MFWPMLPSRSGVKRIVGRLLRMQLRLTSKSTVASLRLASGLLMSSVGRPAQAGPARPVAEAAEAAEEDDRHGVGVVHGVEHRLEDFQVALCTHDAS